MKTAKFPILFCFLFWAVPVYAYIDPGAGSFFYNCYWVVSRGWSSLLGYIGMVFWLRLDCGRKSKLIISQCLGING